MPHWLHRATKAQLRSVASADLPEARANYIEEPDLSAVLGQPVKYWQIAGDAVTLMSRTDMAAADAAEVAVRAALIDSLTAVDATVLAKALVQARVITQTQLAAAIKAVL
jgi:hypothetical protein